MIQDWISWNCQQAGTANLFLLVDFGVIISRGWLV
jgi:hypothetical protein